MQFHRNNNEGFVTLAKNSEFSPNRIFILMVLASGLWVGMMPTPHTIAEWEDKDVRHNGPLSQVEDISAETEKIEPLPEAQNQKTKNPSPVKTKPDIVKKENRSIEKPPSVKPPEEEDTSYGWFSRKEDKWENEDQSRTLW